uniref:Uncharacterized protein n=1 Tax=Peronospora matthiolae TaxID=2874970 RepID=A0AAV1U3L5_9STRA
MTPWEVEPARLLARDNDLEDENQKLADNNHILVINIIAAQAATQATAHERSRGDARFDRMVDGISYLTTEIRAVMSLTQFTLSPEVHVSTWKEDDGNFKWVAKTSSDFYRQETALTCIAADTVSAT